jgi:hypothetical protein
MEKEEGSIERDKTTLPKKKKRPSILNIWTILSIIVFYLAYNSYSRGDITASTVLGIVGGILVVYGLRGAR